LEFHQQAADKLGGNLLGGGGEEALGEVTGGFWWLWEWLESKSLHNTNHSRQHLA